MKVDTTNTFDMETGSFSVSSVSEGTVTVSLSGDYISGVGEAAITGLVGDINGVSGAAGVRGYTRSNGRIVSMDVAYYNNDSSSNTIYWSFFGKQS